MEGGHVISVRKLQFWYSAFIIGLCISWAVAVIAVLNACFSAGEAKVVPGNSASVCRVTKDFPHGIIAISAPFLSSV